MKKITFKTVDKWARMASKPLKNEFLENFHQPYRRFFYHMVKQMKPKIAVELGIGRGYTLIHMAAANNDAKVIGIDKIMHCGDGDAYRRFANCEVIYLNSLDTDGLLQHYTKEHGPIGIVFQDSSHDPDESLKEFEIYSKYLDKNSIWVCDDITDANEGMPEYFERLPGRKKLYDDLHHETVMGIVLIG